MASRRNGYENNRESGGERAGRMQDRLCIDLQQELHQIEAKRQEFLNRVNRYARLGLLSDEHVAIINRKKVEYAANLHAPKRRRVEPDDVLGNVVSSEAEKRTPAASASTNGVSGQYSGQHSPYQWQDQHGDRSQSPGDDNENCFSVEMPVNSPRDSVVDEDIFCTIRLSGDEDEFVADENDTGFQVPPLGLTHLSDYSKERLSKLKNKINNQYHHTSFPRQCPLCDISFSTKKTLTRHIVGDASQGRRAACVGLVGYLMAEDMVPPVSMLQNSAAPGSDLEVLPVTDRPHIQIKHLPSDDGSLL